MSRSRRRASRALIGILVVTLVLGLIIHLHNLKKTSATEQAAPVAVAKPADPVLVAPAEPIAPQALVTITPTEPISAKTDEKPQALPTAKPAEINPLSAFTAMALSTDTKKSDASNTSKPATIQPENLTTVTSKPPAGDSKKPAPVAGPATKPAAGAEANAAKPSEKITDPLAASKAKVEAGQLLAGRKILVDAIVSGNLNAEDAASARQSLNEINAAVVFSKTRFNTDEFGGTFVVPAGGVLSKIAHTFEVTPDLLMQVNGITDARKLRAGQAIKVLKGPFNAVVYKHDFRLEVWQGEPNAKGSMFVISFSVGLGKDDGTPTGVWAIQNKLKDPAYYSPRGEGVIASSDPKNPLGEYWIGLTGVDGQAVGKASYGIHGTIDPDSIGKQESLGCIRLRNEDVAVVYELLVEGKSTVTVKD